MPGIVPKSSPFVNPSMAGTVLHAKRVAVADGSARAALYTGQRSGILWEPVNGW